MLTTVTRTPPKHALLFPIPAPKRHGGLFAPQPSLAWVKHWRRKSVPAQVHAKRPLPFRNFPPPPKRSSRPLPLALQAARAYIEQRFQAGEGYTLEGIALLCLVQQMPLDSVLFSRDWRLELVWTGKKGYPYFGLYCLRHLMGIVDIPDVVWGQTVSESPALPRLQSQMAAYLVECGFTRANTVLVEGLARTPVKASKRDVYRLFK